METNTFRSFPIDYTQFYPSFFQEFVEYIGERRLSGNPVTDQNPVPDDVWTKILGHDINDQNYLVKF